MHFRTTHVLRNPTTLLLLSGIILGCSQPSHPLWTEDDFKEPAALAAILNDPMAAKPAIFNVGSVEQIKGAIAIGPASKPAPRETLKEQLSKLPADKEIIVYCGCCPFPRCANVMPAFELCKQMKFTNTKMLKLPYSLKEDWTDKGYPMD
jgi:thiosulfate/3-mercaptopyruvate sulfurtransferase